MRPSSIVNRLGVMTLGSVVSQLVPIAIQPLLKSIFPPEYFGQIELVVRISVVLSLLFYLRLDLVFFKGVSVYKRLRVLGTLLGFSLILMLIGLVIAYIIVVSFGLELIYIFIPLLAFAYARNKILVAFRVSTSRYKQIAWSRVGRRLTDVLIYSGAFLWFSKYILILAELSGVLMMNFVLWPKKLSEEKFPNRIFRVIKPFSFLVKENKHIVVGTSTSDIVNMVSDSLIFFMIAISFTAKEVGFLELAFKFTILPTGFVTSNISPVFLEEMSKKLNHRSDFISSLKKFIILIGLIVLCYLGGVLLLKEYAWVYLFDELWASSRELLLPLSVIGALSMGISAFGQVLLVTGKNYLDLRIKILKLVLLGGVMFFLNYSFIEVVYAYVALYGLFYLIYGIAIFNTIRKTRIPS